MIKKLIPDYKEVQTIFRNIASEKGGFSFENQSFLTEFWNEYSDIKLVESEILKLVINTDEKTRALVLGRLCEAVTATIDAYNNHKDLFNSSVVDWAKRGFDKCHTSQSDVDAQLKVCREAWAKFKELDNSLEWRSYSLKEGSRELEELEQQVEKQKKIYNAESEKMKEIWQNFAESIKEWQQFQQTQFSKIASLSELILSIVQQYIPQGNKPKPLQVSAQLFSPKLITGIHSLCNGEQFEDITKSDLTAVLNLQETEANLRIKDKKTGRVYYLLHCLENTLEEDARMPWRKAILARLGLKESSYKAHYRDVVSDMPGRKNEEFAEAMDTIFKK